MPLIEQVKHKNTEKLMVLNLLFYSSLSLSYVFQFVCMYNVDAVF